MPFSQFKAFYEPEALDLLARVFDEAWPEFRASWPSDNENMARELLAARIMLAHRAGESDPGALKTAALRGIVN